MSEECRHGNVPDECLACELEACPTCASNAKKLEAAEELAECFLKRTWRHRTSAPSCVDEYKRLDKLARIIQGKDE